MLAQAIYKIVDLEECRLKELRLNIKRDIDLDAEVLVEGG